MDADEFLVWAEGREGTWELVDGVPRLKRLAVPAELMAGTTVQHDQLRQNIEFALLTRLRDGPCRVFSEAIATRVATRKIRRPDVSVDCGDPAPQATETSAPTILVEILSSSTRKIDRYEKPAEYKQLPTLQHFVLVEPGIAACIVWTRREDDRWEDQPVIGLDSTLRLTALNIELPLAEIYRGVQLEDPT